MKVNFSGNCREVMNFYQKVFGGELHLQTFGEVYKHCPIAIKYQVMHGNLMGGIVEFLATA